MEGQRGPHLGGRELREAKVKLESRGSGGSSGEVRAEALCPAQIDVSGGRQPRMFLMVPKALGQPALSSALALASQ